MRIALMTNNYKPFLGGVPISVERLKNGLEALGHQVTVFAPTYEEQVEEVGVFRYATCMKHFLGGIVLPNPFDRRIEQEFCKNTYDVIHVHHPVLIGNTARYLSKKYHIPLVFTYHTRYEQYLSYVGVIRMLEQGAGKQNADGSLPIYAKMDRAIMHGIQDVLVPKWLRSFLKHCDYVFAPTRGMQQYLQEACQLSDEKIAILPTGLEEAAFLVKPEEKEALRKRYGAEDIPLLLSVSRMSHEKNVEFLLESIARVKEQYGKPFRLLMVGEGPNRMDYERLCRERGLEEIVCFTGKVPNEQIAPYFAAADAFVFASKTETQGIVILEAFAGATPVYALDASGVSDLVVEGVNGRLCEENQDEFARLVLRFLQGEDRALNMENNAYETALTFQEEAVARKALAIYNKAIAAKEGAAQKAAHSSWRKLLKHSY